MVYDPIVCLILQGEKAITVGDETVCLRDGDSVIAGHDLPVLARITRASRKTPYLALIIRLELDLLRSLDDALGGSARPPDAPRSMEVAGISPESMGVLERYGSLLADPTEAEVLLPLVYEELHFRPNRRHVTWATAVHGAGPRRGRRAWHAISPMRARTPIPRSVAAHRWGAIRTWHGRATARTSRSPCVGA